MNNSKNDSLQKLIQINNSLDEINLLNDINGNNINLFNNNNKNDYNEKTLSPLNLSDFSSLNSDDKNDKGFSDNLSKNNYLNNNSPLNEIIRINQNIDSIYDSMLLMKSSNKINSKILNQVNHSSQTFENY